MSKVARSFTHPMGTIALDTPLDGVFTPCSDYPFMSASQTSTLSPASYDSVISQPPSTLVPATSFFEDAIEAPSLPIDAGMDFSTSHQPCPAPQTVSHPSKATAPVHQSQAMASEGKHPIRRSAKKESQPKSKRTHDRRRTTPKSEASKPKKRGRKPKKQPQDPESTDFQEEDLESDGLPSDPRRRRILERNRIAATKCRLRKRDEASALASREHAMEDQNRYLASCFDSLTAEIYHLKTQLLRHTDCGCVLIQKYIAHEAKKSVDSMVGGSPTGFHSESTSPHCGGSSRISSTESMKTGSEAESVQSSWPTSFHQAPVLTTPSGGVPGPDLEEHRRMSMMMDQPAPIPLPMAAGPLEGCGNGLLAGSELQQEPGGSIAWNTPWAN